MARTGWSASNFLRAPAVLTAAPLTIACWGFTSITGSLQWMAGLYNSGSTSARNSFVLYVGATNVITAQLGDGSTAGFTNTVSTISANTWFHACASFSGAARNVYLNGTGKVSAATALVPTGLNRSSIGVGDGNTTFSPFAPAGTGYLAEVGMWSVVLDDAEVAALSKGLSPLQVRPVSLVGYWPLYGNNSPENNFKSNANAAVIQGSLSQAAHPRVILPHRRAF